MPSMNNEQTRLRLLVGKVGLDGHDRGAKIVARALRDAGHDVIYTGLHRTPEQVVDTAVQEDVDAIGLSILSGAHLTLFPRVIELLRERDAADIVVFGGGIMPAEDVAELKESGVAEIFLPGTTTGTFLDWISENVKPKSLS
jgi:methylmalonyl-CoA mutase C-terminal domain/subunit